MSEALKYGANSNLENLSFFEEIEESCLTSSYFQKN